MGMSLDPTMIATRHEANDGIHVGEDGDHVGAPLDLAVEALEWVGRVQLPPVVLGKGHSPYRRPTPPPGTPTRR